MKLAYSTVACPQWTIEQAFAAVRPYGYDGLEVGLLNGEMVSPALGAEARRRVPALARQAEVSIACLATSVKLAQPDPAAREVQVRDGQAMLEMAAEWGAPMIRVFGGPPAGTPQAETNAAMVDGLARLAPRARELGVAIVIETHDAFCSSVELMRVLEAVANPITGVFWDLYYPHTLGEAVADTAARVRERLQYVHVNDGHPSGEGGEGWTQTLLGEGIIPVREALRAMREFGYDGWLSVEWAKLWIPELAEPEVALPQHAAVLREYLAGLE